MSNCQDRASRATDNRSSIDGKTILYTGAAGGLGCETTQHLLRAGANVVALDNNPEKAAALKKESEEKRLAGLILSCVDLSDAVATGDALADLSKQTGGFDIVINNAAIYPSKPFEEYSLEEHQQVQRINVDAGIQCVQAALPHMRARKWGRIINISSVTVYGGWENLSPYVQSKAALIGLTRAWAREFGKYGITVNAVAPGAFPTDAESIHPYPEAYTQYVLDHQSIKRRGTPGDMANILIFLASESSSFITGQTINVDGGWVMQ